MRRSEKVSFKLTFQPPSLIRQRVPETGLNRVFAEGSVELALPVSAVLLAQEQLPPAQPSHLVQADCSKLVFSKLAQIDAPR